ncbi:DUF2079 domain-containing protein [Waterburya agarophytonicola K14]|uniref:DUF2079 domain-containing protein n=1 Tax=Waterburya agarophytonicola KI4 TaxID=2874699 RepID=A0A964BNR3_9CYAN|nr:DUF2079 domain-containing protein [Waterburya agarophytonicola]MCC0176077.1 DUF2079 domain-containing protein [Waterburya agarophytonicola KI4]
MLSKLNTDPERKILIVGAIAFFVCTLSLTLHRHFSFYSSYDQGIFNQVFWNGTHGNFFQSTLSSQLSTNVVHSNEVAYVGYHRLGQHFTPALLLWLPIYYVFPYPATLTVLQAIFVTAAGLVLYQLGKIYLESAIAILITFSFYGANAVFGPTLANFHDISQIPLFVFSLLWAMEKRRWWLFVILAICVLAVREDSGITLFGIGMYMILSRRFPRIGLGVCSVSFLYMVALTNLIMPMFSDDISKRFMLERFGQYADGDEASTLEILKNMLTSPGLLLVELFTPFFATLKYLLGQWLPLAFIPVVAPASWAIATFPLLKLLLGKGETVLVISIRYAMSVTPGLFYGAILWWAGQGFGNINKSLAECQPRKLRPKFRRFWIFCICLSIFFTITSNPSRTLSFIIPDSISPRVYISPLKQWQHVPHIRALLAQIPPDASVSASTYIIPHLSGRREIIRIPGLEFKNDNQQVVRAEYIIADLWQMEQYQVAFGEDRNWLQTANNLITSVTDKKEYGIVDFSDGVILLRQGVDSNSKALLDWKTYQGKIQPILESS